MTHNVNQPKNINDVSDELLLYIFSFLRLETLPRLYGVCHRWRRVGNDPSLWKNYPFIQSIPAEVSQVERRQWFCERVNGRRRPLMQVMATLKDAVGRPTLVHFNHGLFILYEFSTTGSRGLRLVNLVTRQEWTHPTADQKPIAFYYLGQEDFFVALCQWPPGAQCKVTFLGPDLQKATTPSLQVDVKNIWKIEPFEQEGVRGVIVQDHDVSPRVRVRLFALINNEWKESAQVDTGCGGSLLVQKPSGTEIVTYWANSLGISLEGKKWDPSANSFSDSWQCSVMGLCSLCCGWSVKINKQDYFALAGNNDQMCLLPIQATGNGLQWSFKLPFMLSGYEGAALRLFPLGGDEIPSTERRYLLVVQYARFGESRMTAAQFLLLPDGKAKQLATFQLDKVFLPEPLGAVQTKNSLGLYYYESGSHQVRRIELLQPEPRVEKMGYRLVVLALLSLYLATRTIKASVDFHCFEGLGLTTAWAKAVARAGGCAIMGFASREGQRRLHAEDQQWLSLLLLAAFVTQLVCYTWGQPLRQKMAAWGLATLIACNRSWPPIWATDGQSNDHGELGELTIIPPPDFT
jgi:hypothetical protein